MWRTICVLMLLAVLDAMASPQNVQGQEPHIVAIPFYGGAKGQVLQITKDSQGGVINEAIVPESANTIQQIRNTEMHKFANHLYNIQSSAQKLVELQEKTKKSGQFKSDDQQVYASNLAILGEAAASLAQLGGSGTDHDFTKLFLERSTKKGTNSKDNKKKGNIKEEEGQGEEDEDVGEQQEGESAASQSETTDNEAVSVNGPSDSASVAEAKPVGVAIAGEGGVASSKPVATAVVGPGGLAISRPVATAIAGVDPNNIGFSQKFPTVAKQQFDAVQAFESQQQPAYAQYMEYPQYFQMPQAYPPINFAIY